jgi:hypothetical protein
VKNLLRWLFCLALVVVFCSGCGMFGDTKLYTGLLALCARCHADSIPAEVSPLDKSAPGEKGPGGRAGCAAKCTFTMSH